MTDADFGKLIKDAWGGGTAAPRWPLLRHPTDGDWGCFEVVDGKPVLRGRGATPEEAVANADD